MKISRRAWMAGVTAALCVRPVMANKMLTPRQHRAIRSWGSLPKLEVVYGTDLPHYKLMDLVFPNHTIGYTDADGNVFRLPPVIHAVKILARDYRGGEARVILDLYGTDVQYATKNVEECAILMDDTRLCYAGLGWALDLESDWHEMKLLPVVRFARSRR